MAEARCDRLCTSYASPAGGGVSAGLRRHASYADADFMAQRLREGLEKSYENAAENDEP